MNDEGRRRHAAERDASSSSSGVHPPIETAPDAHSDANPRVTEFPPAATRAPESVAPPSVSSNRLAALGAVAGSVAHEINNPAAFLLLGLDILARSPAMPADSSELLEELKASTRHIVDVIRALRMIASDTAAVPPGGTDVAQSVGYGLLLVRGRVAEIAEVVSELSPVPNVAMSPSGAIWAVVSALLVAVESIPRDARPPRTLHVETRLVCEEPRAAPEVELSVRAFVAEDVVAQPARASLTSDAARLALELTRGTVQECSGRFMFETPEPAPGQPAVRVVVRLPALT